jgi:hypothetical protein
MQHTWVSPNTLGKESTVTVTFQKHGEDTLMTLVHSDLPDTDEAKGTRTVGTTSWVFFVSNSAGLWCNSVPASRVHWSLES